MFGATDIEMKIFTLLASGERLYGLEMVKKSDGKLKKGTVYVYLSRMENKELVQSEAVKDPREAGPPRRKYWITAKGAKIYARENEMRNRFSVFEQEGICG